MNRLKVGISPLLWSNDDFSDIGGHISLVDCLSDIRDIGYLGCEIGSKYPTESEELARLSAAYNIEFCNQWFSLYLLTRPMTEVEKDFRAHLTKLKTLGANVVGVAELSYNTYSDPHGSPFQHKPILTDHTDWEAYGKLLDHLGDIAIKEYNIELCYHHHLGTVINSSTEIDLLMAHTDPEKVFLNYDCGHLLMACEDPLKVWQKHAKRIRHVHLKNVIEEIRDQSMAHQWSFKKAILNGLFTIPGDDTGMLQSEVLLDLILSTNYRGWLIIEAELNPLIVDSKAYALTAKNYIDNCIKSSINYLCIGHACHDLATGGYSLGGTVSYSSLLAQQFGRQVGVWTSFGRDFQFTQHFIKNGIELIIKDSESTTVFENIYTDQGRTQYLKNVAGRLSIKDLPDKAKSIDVIHFGPIADEIDIELTRQFPNSLKAATIQGWLRNRQPDGLIRPKSINWAALSALDIVIYSEEDVQGLGQVTEQIIKHVPIVIVTRGAQGVDAYQDGHKSVYPAYPTEEVDPTGAGDVFSTAFIIKYHESKDIRKAVAFGQVASSLIVERKGTYPIPTIPEIEDRLLTYKY